MVIYNRTLSITNTNSTAGAVLHLSEVEAQGNIRPKALRRTVRSATKRTCLPAVAAAALLAGALVFTTGCGNTYRPVVTAINPVGPAAQPQKYAVAVASSPNGTNGLITLVDFSGDTVLVNANVGVNPYYMNLDTGGVTGYTLNGDGTVTSFDISPALQTRDVLQTTLLPGANPVSIFSQGGFTYIAEPGRNAVAELKGSPLALQQELPVAANVIYVAGAAGAPRAYAISQGTGNGQVAAIETTSNTISNTLTVGRGPVYGVMTADGKRAFILNKTDGTVSVINAQSNQLDQFVTGSFTGTTTSDSASITGVSSIAGLTAGQLVSGAGIPTGTTIISATGSTVLLSASATAGGTGTVISTYSSAIPVGVAPVWADLAPTRTELIVANAGNGTSVGSLSIINIPLCQPSALVSNPNCDATDPIDAAGFGQVLANVPVGHSPIMVAVLQDGTRAYVANYADSTVSVVNLTSNTVTATIPVVGRPIYIAATQGTPTGKVYVVSADTVAPNKNSVMTIINTVTDTVSSTINLQGTGVSVRVTAP
jgi:YVTN family beta-propeller protein